MALLTLLDFLKIRHNGVPYVEIVNETVKQIPEVSGMYFNPVTMAWTQVPNIGAGKPIDGLSFPSLIRKSLPNVPFRNFNEGGDFGKGDFESRIFQCRMINPKWGCDRAFEAGETFGERMAEDATANTEAAMQTLGSQFYYGIGSGGDAKGHPGLVDFVASANVIDATGTGNACSSVWAVKYGMGHVEWLWGNKLTQINPLPIRYGDVTEGGKTYTAAIQEAYLYPGLKVGSTKSVARIKNLSAATGKKLTIARMNSLHDLWSANGVRPDAYFMTARSQRQLTDDHVTELIKNPPLVTNWNGIPIIPTQSITDTETAS